MYLALSSIGNLSDNMTNQEERIQTSLERNHGIPDDTTNVQIALTDYSSSNSNTPSIMWLLFTHNNDGKWKFLDPSYGKVYFHHFPDLSDVTFHFAKDGWLVLSQGITSMFLFNPFTTQRLDLPDWEKEFGSFALYKPYDMCFSAPPTFPDCNIFEIYGVGPFVNISFCRIEDKKWTTILLNDNNVPFVVAHNNPIYYDGLFYCLDCFGKLGVYDPSRNTWIALSEPRGVNLELKCNDEQAQM